MEFWSVIILGPLVVVLQRPSLISHAESKQEILPVGQFRILLSRKSPCVPESNMSND